MRDRSRACSASCRPTAWTDSSSARATVPSSSSPYSSGVGERSPARYPRRDRRDQSDTLADSRRQHPADQQGGNQRDVERDERGRDGAHELPPDARQRDGDADVRDRRVRHGNRDVEHVDVDGVAVAARRPEPGFARLHHFGPPRVVFHRGDAGRGFRGVADDNSVARNERHPGVEQLADAVGLGVVLGDQHRALRHTRCRGGRSTRQQFAGELRFGDKRLFDALVGLPRHRPRKQPAGDDQADHGRCRRRREELGLEGHQSAASGDSSSL